MNKKILLIFCLFVFAVANVHAAKGYKISIKIENTKDSLLILGNYYANKQLVQDSARVSKSGWFVFESKDKELLPGMYFILASGSGSYFDFIINQDPINYTFETKADNLTGNMKVTNSKDNTLFFNYTKHNYENFEKINELRKNEKKEDSVAVHNKIEKLSDELDNYKLDFMAQNPTHLLTYVFNATKEIEVPEAPKDLDSNAQRTFSYLYYINHYFDNTKLDYDGMIRTPEGVFYKRFHNYFDKVIYGLPADSVIKYVDLTIEKTRPSKEMFKYAVWSLADKYLQSPIMTYDAVYVHIVKKYYTSGDAFWATPTSIQEESKRANTWEKLLVGKPAPPFATMDTNDVWVPLYSVKAKFTLVVFWSPDCGHCATVIPEMHKFYLENKNKYNLEVYAVNTDIAETEKWKEFIRKHKLSWINTDGKVSDIDWREVYNVNMTPIMFLLDKDKVIIGKRLDTNILKEILDDKTKEKK